MYYVRLLIVVIAALSTGLARSVESTSFVTARVTHVTDGDTLWIDVPQGRPERLKLRLAQVDAPELCQAGGLTARAWLQARVLHRVVRVQVLAIDDYGRSIARVDVDGEDLGAMLVEAGQAWSFGRGRSKGRYAREESRARSAMQGVFADPLAMEPRVFRRVHGPCEGHGAAAADPAMRSV